MSCVEFKKNVIVFITRKTALMSLVRLPEIHITIFLAVCRLSKGPRVIPPRHPCQMIIRKEPVPVSDSRICTPKTFLKKETWDTLPFLKFEGEIGVSKSTGNILKRYRCYRHNESDFRFYKNNYLQIV